MVVDILTEATADAAGAAVETVGITAGSTSVNNSSSNVVVGTSEWLDRKAGTARVEVSYSDDLVALAAFKTAEEFLNNMTA